MTEPVSINLFSLAWPVTSLGPGRRAVIWVAGCRKRCPGCVSPEMRLPESGTPAPAAALARRLLRLDEALAGVTISGGEPFGQADALTALLEAVRERRPDWSVIVYTGHTLATLKRRTEARGLLEMCDVLIAGPYRRETPQTHPLAGSGNQKLHLLTPRGRKMKPELDAFPANAVNFGLGPGLVNMVIGVPGGSPRWEPANEGCACDT